MPLRNLVVVVRQITIKFIVDDLTVICFFCCYSTEPLCMKAEYLMLRGRALNVLPQYSREAEDCLSKAVKLDPKLAEAWSYLGECYWKNNQVELARSCFVGSLNHVTKFDCCTVLAESPKCNLYRLLDQIFVLN